MPETGTCDEERPARARTVAAAVIGAMLLGLIAAPPAGERAAEPIPDEPAFLPTASSFLENAGQLRNRDVRYYGGAGGLQVAFGESAILYVVKKPATSPEGREPSPALAGSSTAPPPEAPTRGVLLRITFEGAHSVIPQARGELPHRSHFFLGNDPSAWRTNVRSYREVVYENLYDGVDLTYQVSDEGVKYEWLVRPGADPGWIVLRYDGVGALTVDGTGALVARTSLGEIHDSPPSSYQPGGGEVACSFVLRDAVALGLECRGWDNRLPLVIDPLIYSTFLGGSDFEFPHSDAIVVDALASVYVAGETRSTDFPTTPGAFDTTFELEDGFVAKLNPDGSALVYMTFLGGTLRDRAYSMALGGDGSMYVTGMTTSTDFPVTPGAFDTTLGPSCNPPPAPCAAAFVVKLDPTGSALAYSTYIDDAVGLSIAVDASGGAHVAGVAGDYFPATPGAFDTACNECNNSSDGFAAWLSPIGDALLYGTYLGGSELEDLRSMKIDANGNVYLAGYTYSPDFPTTPGAFDETFNSNTTYQSDVFVAKLHPAGSALLYSTFLGGSFHDDAFDLDIDADGNAYVVGRTFFDFPVTVDAFDTTPNGMDEIFATKLNPSGSGLVFSTYLGGVESDYVATVDADADGNAYVAGMTYSADFPVTPGAFDGSLAADADAFVSKLDPDGKRLLYSTFLGGTYERRGGFNYSQESVTSIAVDLAGDAHLAGVTQVPDFPVTAGAFDTSYNGGYFDVFVAKLRLGPAPPPRPEACPFSQGFWKNHEEAWPVASLDLGNETYDQSALLALLRTPPRGDASLILAHQLIAAKLNVANGCDPTPIAAALDEADALLAAHPGKLPYGVRASAPEGQPMIAAAEVLDSFNNGALTPGC